MTWASSDSLGTSCPGCSPAGSPRLGERCGMPSAKRDSHQGTRDDRSPVRAGPQHREATGRREVPAVHRAEAGRPQVG